MPRRPLGLACLLSIIVVTTSAAAREAPSGDDVAAHRDEILLRVDKSCREVLDEQLAGSSGDVRDVFLAKIVDPDAFCGCAIRNMRSALDSGQVDVFDDAGIARLHEDSVRACTVDRLVDHFQSYCDALFIRFYGPDIFTGPYAADISRFCDCSKAELQRLGPESLYDTMVQTQADHKVYRESGRIEDKDDGSLVSIFAACGIVDLKQRLIESMNSDVPRPTSP